jgi:hypothetical protein
MPDMGILVVVVVLFFLFLSGWLFSLSRFGWLVVAVLLRQLHPSLFLLLVCPGRSWI